MFGKRVTLFKLLGFEVRVDLSWLVLAALITWSLAKGVFPHYVPGLEAASYWWMGLVGALALFGSIVLHELSHSLVARRDGLPMKGITLFIFGGVAEMGEEPPSAGAEFRMAVAGPLASVVIGVTSLGLYAAGSRGGWPQTATAILGYVGWVNLLLAAFNMVPAFPLDGGRVLRAGLWKLKDNLRWATRIASAVGSAFGYLLMFLGVVNMFRGDIVGGLWWLLIGMFLNSASQGSYQHLLVRRALAGEAVSRFMKRNPVTVTGEISVAELVEDYVYTYHYKMYPVVDGGRLSGCVTTADVKQVRRDQWPQRRVRDIAQACSERNTVAPDSDATEALAVMHRGNLSRLMVVDSGRLVGVLALKDLMRFIGLKMDLEGKGD